MQTSWVCRHTEKIHYGKTRTDIVYRATGSGKSTSLAALIDYRNTNASGHIITIEDLSNIYIHTKNLWSISGKSG